MSANMSKAEPAGLFAALGDVNRLTLISRLADGRPRSIAELGRDAAISRQALSKHLRVLERAGAVSSARFGREVRFRIEQQRLAEAQTFLAIVSAQWDAALERLRTHVKIP
jgi:DNA-binding transcriptional ArsR family regulator